ncbi:MAG: hypothetical protein M3R15_35300 [Acidobacteriota bacterium]|nr:hypothetical protein [Acidobacteriota bacterium]
MVEETRINKITNEGGEIGRYKNIWRANIRLHQIARLAVAAPRPDLERSTLWREELTLTFLDEIDERGIVRVSKDLFTEAMDETEVEAARIRKCPVCHRIFWAGRIDARQCGAAKCKSVLSSRLSRNPELREQYNKARRKKRKKRREAQKHKQPTTKKGK